MADDFDHTPKRGADRNFYDGAAQQNARLNNLEGEVHQLRDEFRMWKEGSIVARTHMEIEMAHLKAALNGLIERFDTHVIDQQQTIKKICLMMGIFLAAQLIDPAQFIAALGLGRESSDILGQFGRAGLALLAFWYIFTRSEK